ncbi:MAG: prepilin-type N-terminal cleavage/methylation domain-containing protein [Sandaracinobacter sp.]
MRIFGPTASRRPAPRTRTRAAARRRDPSKAAAQRHREAGFTLVEMLVAMVLLSLVGLTLARFQTFQLSGAANLATAAAARLEADNLAVDVLAAPGAPSGPTTGVGSNAGRTWHYSITPTQSPAPATMPDLVQVEIAVSLLPGGPVLARRTVVRGRGNPGVAQ